MDLIKHLLLVVVLIISTSCNKKNKNKKNQILKYPLSTEVSTLDPAISYDTVSAKVVYQMYETLYEYEYLKRPYTLKPLLAAKLPVIEKNGLKYTIQLKKGIQFHTNEFISPKRTLKAQDFITAIKRIAFNKTRSSGWWLFDGKIKGINDFRKKTKTIKDLLKNKISGLKAPNDHTLVIELIKPYPQLLYALAMSFSSPIPAEIIEKTKNDLSRTDIGTGPFYLESWQKASKLIIKKFPGYRHEKYPRLGDRYSNENKMLKDTGKRIPFLSEVQFHIMKEAQTRWLNFKSHKIDLLLLSKDNYETALTSMGNLSKELKEEGKKLMVSPTLTYWWLAFNMNDPLLGKNLNLRKAIAYAVNVDEYVKIFTKNVGQKANSIYPPGIGGYSPLHQLPYGYNLEKAKAYLKLAGYPNGKGLPQLTYDVRGNSTTSRQYAEFIQKELSKIGIDIKISTNSFPQFLKKLKNGDLQFWLGGWSLDYPDAENIIQLLITKNHPPGTNGTYYSNPLVDKYYQQIAILPDNAIKFELMEKVQEIINKDLPWAMLYYTRNYVILDKKVQNYRHSDIIYNFMKYIRIEAD